MKKTGENGPEYGYGNGYRPVRELFSGLFPEIFEGGEAVVLDEELITRGEAMSDRDDIEAMYGRAG
jgi:hypothetical protein